MKKIFGRPLSIPSLQSGRNLSPLGPVSLVLLSVGSAQLGTALAKGLFPVLGPMGTVGLRVGCAALLLLLFNFTQLRRGYSGRAYGVALLFGLTLTGMNLCFYLALEHIPMGIAVSLEFIGPLLLAVFQSRRVIDFLWVLLAGGGILLLTPINGETHLSLVGIGLALLAGVFWATYVLLGVRMGSVFPSGAGLAISMIISAFILVPIGVTQAGTALLDPIVLLIGASVGILATALPYSLELEALKSLPPRVFSILLSIEPMVAALMGLIFLQERLTWRSLAALTLISVASVGVVFFQNRREQGSVKKENM